MTISATATDSAFAVLFEGTSDAASLAARCGDDVVRLRPAWPAVIAATRFARGSRWFFGNRAASLTCVEPRARRWLSQRGAADPVQVHFNLGQWGSAYARCERRAREIDVFAIDGSPVAAVRFDDADASLDELLWVLVDDDQRPRIPLLRRVAPARCAFARAGRLVPHALQAALLAAFAARLPLRITLANAGGSVVWSPHNPVLRDDGMQFTLQSALGSITLSDPSRAGGTVHLAGFDRGDPRIDACGDTGAPWLSIALADATPRERIAWRGICAALPERSP